MANFDWPTIRALYQSGRTAYQLAKMPGYPSKQAIAKRAKKEGWLVGNGNGNLEGNSVADHGTAIVCGSFTEDQARVLASLRIGATLKQAAACVGKTDRTLRQWREKDSSFAVACNVAQEEFAMRQVKNIDAASARDWKASAWLLERHPVSRGEFSPPSARNTDSGLQIILHIDRSKREIDYLEDVTPTPALIEGEGTDRNKTGSESDGSGSQGMAIDYPPPEAKPSPITNLTPSSDTSLRDPLQRTR